MTSPEFFAPEAYRAKVKTPFEFVVSALRATGADVSSGSSRSVRALAGLGMPLYLCQPPTGYDETADGVGVVRRARQPHELRAGARRRTDARCPA